MYSFIFRVFFARMDPERAHHLAFAVIRRLPGALRALTRPDASLRV